MKSDDLNIFIVKFNLLMDEFDEFLWLKNQMKNYYIHNELFNKIRNSIISEKQEILAKSNRVDFDKGTCHHELPYCFAARSSRSLQNNNFIIQNNDFLQNLTFDKFAFGQNRVFKATRSLRSTTALQKFREINIEDSNSLPIMSREELPEDFVYFLNETCPSYPFNLETKKEGLSFENLNLSNEPKLLTAHSDLLIVRCNHNCFENRSDLILNSEKREKKIEFFKKTNNYVFENLGNRIECLLNDKVGSTMKIIKHLIQKEEAPCKKKTVRKNGLRQKSSIVNGHNFYEFDSNNNFKESNNRKGNLFGKKVRVFSLNLEKKSRQ